MKKILSHKKTHLGFLASISFFLLLTFPLITYGADGGFLSGLASKIAGGAFDVVGLVLTPITITLMGLTSFIVMLSGVLLNSVIYETVIKMAYNFSHVPAIDSTWSVVRDVANMGFIFVLLYAAIKTIIGQGSDNKELIVKVVIAAILVNFSLFFTKLVIDAANVLALLFYGAIAPGATADGISGGIANSFMDIMNLQTLFSAKGVLNAGNFTTVGVLGSLVMLIAAFSFVAVSILFIIRYVVLIFVLILSPLAFVAGIMPGLSDIRTKWWNALSGQAFFAPIYFFLIWVSLSVLQGFVDGQTQGTGNWAEVLGGTIKQVNGTDVVDYKIGAVGLVIQFSVVIAFMIAALVIAKSWAEKAGPQAKALTKWATGMAGGATMGVAGRFGRGTLGAAGSAIGDSERLKRLEEKGGFAGAAARLSLAAGRKTSKASFDVRGTALGGSLDAGKAQKGGFAEDLKNSAEKKKKYGESLGPSDIVIDEAEQKLKSANTQAERITARRELDKLKGVSEDDAKKRIRKILEGRGRTEAEINTYFGSPEGRAAVEKRKIKGAGEKRKEGYAKTLRDPRWIKGKLNPVLMISKTNKQAAAELRKGKKSAKQLFDDAVAAAGGGTPPAGGAPPPPAGGGTPPPPPPAGGGAAGGRTPTP